MPRRNKRPVPPPTSKKALDHWMQMCKELTEKGQAQRIDLTSKKDRKEVKS